MPDNKFLSDISGPLQDKIIAFMDDVRRRTNIFEGRRSVEEQLSDEYHGRFLIELIQNADDACGRDGSIFIVVRQYPSPRIVVLNTGKGFTSKNFESLCTLGLTDKDPEEAIGNKGMGFRSVLEVCKAPTIYSSNPYRPDDAKPGFDGYCFCFSPDLLLTAMEKTLQHIISGNEIPSMDIADLTFQLSEYPYPEIFQALKERLQDPKVLDRALKTLPVYEMPVPSDPSDALLDWASSEGAVTGVFLDIKPGTEEILQTALAELDAYTFLFLRNARFISVFLENSLIPLKLVEFERDIPRSIGEIKKGKVNVKYHEKAAWAGICGKSIGALNNNSKGWWFHKKQILRNEFEEALGKLPERWHKIQQIEVEVAVPLGKASDAEGRFAIYLPTLAKTGTGAWVNAPFYGKIDRTNIDWERAWNSGLLGHAVDCVTEMVAALKNSPDIESGQAILNLFGIIDKNSKLAEAQISSESIQQIIREEAWLLCEPDTKGTLKYELLSGVALPEDLSWVIKPIGQIMSIACREKVPFFFPHPELMDSGTGLIRETAKAYNASLKKLEESEMALLAEIAIRETRKEEKDSDWWNQLYRWLGYLDLSYEALIGKRLVWTQTGIYKIQEESRIFSPPRRLVASDDDDSPMIKRLQEVLAGNIPGGFHDRVAFLHPEIDLGDKHINSFFIKGGRSKTVAIDFRTEPVASFILRSVCRELYRETMSKKRKKDASEIFGWTFILWRQSRGEGISVDWGQLLILTNTGFQPGYKSYAGKAWTGDEGEALEKVFKNSIAHKPFVLHPNNLIQVLPKIYREIINEFDLNDDLNQFVVNVLKVWTAPKIFSFKATRVGGAVPEMCPEGYNYSLDTSVLDVVPKKFKLPIEQELWGKYLLRIKKESKDHPYSKPASYVLNEVVYIEEIQNPASEPEALARCLAHGWDKYYKNQASTIIRTHPMYKGQSIQWSVTGFVVEQLKYMEWIPMRIWATRIEEGKENSKEFFAARVSEEVVKVSKELFGPGSALIYSLIPHILPEIEEYFSENLCEKIGIVIFSQRQRNVQEPLLIMSLLSKAHGIFPKERENLLLSLWQDLFDATILNFSPDKLPNSGPPSILGYEVQKDGNERMCWLKPKEDKDLEIHTVWVNDNDNCLSLLPPGTLVAYAGKSKVRMEDRITVLMHILPGVHVKRLSELRTVPAYEQVNGWEEPKLLSDAFPWLIQPALAILAYGRKLSPPMSVSNPKGEFHQLATRLMASRVRYVSNLHLSLEGMDVKPEPKSIFYFISDNLLLLDKDTELKLRELAVPLTSLFDKEDYRDPAEIWLRDVEEATMGARLIEDVPLEMAINMLKIKPAYLHELSQVIGGQTQQILRSLAPALLALAMKGQSPLSADEINNQISKVSNSGKQCDLAQEVAIDILSKSGVLDPSGTAALLCEVAEHRRDPTEIAMKVFELLRIELSDWNTAAQKLRAQAQIISNHIGIEVFNKTKQDTKWAACGFLQRHLNDSRREEFKKRWESYEELKPSARIHLTWEPTKDEIELPIINWFKTQEAELSVGMDEEPAQFLEHLISQYAPLARDPEDVLNENVKSLNLSWKRLRGALASLALRGQDGGELLSDLMAIIGEPLGKWILDNEGIQSSLSVAPCSEEMVYNLLSEWIQNQAVSIKKHFGMDAKTVDDFISANGIKPEEELKANEILEKGPKAVSKQTIAKRPLEIPDKDKSLDDLRKNLDEILNENNQEMLKTLTLDVDIDVNTKLGDAPMPHKREKPKGPSKPVKKGVTEEFIGYVGESFVYKALKRRYPHIGLSSWVSESKQKFYPGSKGDDRLGYDFCLEVEGRKVLIELKSHTGNPDKSFNRH
jgi:hypothetical protein